MLEILKMTFQSFELLIENGLPHTEQTGHNGGAGHEMVGIDDDESAAVVHLPAEVLLVKVGQDVDHVPDGHLRIRPRTLKVEKGSLRTCRAKRSMEQKDHKESLQITVERLAEMKNLNGNNSMREYNKQMWSNRSSTYNNNNCSSRSNKELSKISTIQFTCRTHGIQSANSPSLSSAFKWRSVSRASFSTPTTT